MAILQTNGIMGDQHARTGRQLRKELAKPGRLFCPDGARCVPEPSIAAGAVDGDEPNSIDVLREWINMLTDAFALLPRRKCSLKSAGRRRRACEVIVVSRHGQ